jgi:hypothetical protein
MNPWCRRRKSTPDSHHPFSKKFSNFFKGFHFIRHPSFGLWVVRGIYRVDQFPPKSRDLSPFASLWCSIEWSINKDSRLIRGNADELWESIEMVWSSKSLSIYLWKQNIEKLKDKITSIVKGQAAPWHKFQQQFKKLYSFYCFISIIDVTQ